MAQGRRQPCRLLYKATSSSCPPISHASPSAYTSSFFLCPPLLLSSPGSQMVSPIAKLIISSLGKRHTPSDRLVYMLSTGEPPVGRPSSGIHIAHIARSHYLCKHCHLNQQIVNQFSDNLIPTPVKHVHSFHLWFAIQSAISTQIIGFYVTPYWVTRKRKNPSI